MSQLVSSLATPVAPVVRMERFYVNNTDHTPLKFAGAGSPSTAASPIRPARDGGVGHREVRVDLAIAVAVASG